MEVSDATTGSDACAKAAGTSGGSNRPTSVVEQERQREQLRELVRSHESLLLENRALIWNCYIS